MNDRLSELTGGSGGGGRGGVNPFEVAIDINDYGEAPSKAEDGAFMQGFFDTVNEVKKDIDSIKKACKDLDTLTQQATLTSSATAEADAKAQIHETITRLSVLTLCILFTL
ncbi:unnamed protein product [Choristocarpus tenellus]